MNEDNASLLLKRKQETIDAALNTIEKLKAQLEESKNELAQVRQLYGETIDGLKAKLEAITKIAAPHWPIKMAADIGAIIFEEADFRDGAMKLKESLNDGN